MASKSLLRRITAALGALDVADGPMSRLDAARRLREAAEELEVAEVAAARKAGVTWIEIGACYGLTKQGAQQRFRAARNLAKAIAATPEKKKDDPTVRPVALSAGYASLPPVSALRTLRCLHAPTSAYLSRLLSTRRNQPIESSVSRLGS
jgi:hypothetical protein